MPRGAAISKCAIVFGAPEIVTVAERARFIGKILPGVAMGVTFFYNRIPLGVVNV